MLRGIRALDDPFVRTPKRGTAKAPAYHGLRVPFDGAAKLCMALLMTAYLGAAIAGGYWGQLPFILLFLSGYVGLGLPGASDRLRLFGVGHGLGLLGSRLTGNDRLAAKLHGIVSQQE